MLSSDNVHPNEYGNRYVSSQIIASGKIPVSQTLPIYPVIQNEFPTSFPVIYRGTITLVNGTVTLSLPSSAFVSASNVCMVSLSTPSGTLGLSYRAVCGINVITFTSVSSTGTTVITDNSSLFYVVY